MKKRFFLATITILLVTIAAYALFKSDLLPGWPIIGGPCLIMDIDTNQLEQAELLDDSIELDPYSSRELPTHFYVDTSYGAWPDDRKNLRENVRLHIYHFVTVEGHYFGTGTYVYYLVAENLFYLWGNDYMNHFDGMVGPFVGDPREVLPRVALKTINKSWWCPW